MRVYHNVISPSFYSDTDLKAKTNIQFSET